MAKITTISFRSRASVKIRDSFFTFEYGEDRELEDGDVLEEEKQKLLNDCNRVIDDQILEIKEALNFRESI